MKVALLADIHGNESALRSVLDAARRENVERLFVAGDLIGYYFAPRKVLELLDEWDTAIVKGNHEDMLIASISDDSFLQQIDARYGSGIRQALTELTPQQIKYLCDLPHPLIVYVDELRVLLCHGAPWDVDQYIYPDASDSLFYRCVADNFDLVVLGHTHYPMIKKIGNTVLVNPGSVGQPRHCVPGACWAILDTADCSVSLRSEEYDYSELIMECNRRHPELPYLSEVLQRR